MIDYTDLEVTSLVASCHTCRKWRADLGRAEWRDMPLTASEAEEHEAAGHEVHK